MSSNVSPSVIDIDGRRPSDGAPDFKLRKSTISDVADVEEVRHKAC